MGKVNEVKRRVLEALRARLFNMGRQACYELSPRRWSNAELRRICGAFEGDVVNVSGWRDEDKDGSTYREYFGNARSYRITNYVGTAKAEDGIEGSVFLDLQGELPADLRGCCDVAFCHTVLEHIHDVPQAMRNIAEMTRDIAVLIVPFMQQEHYTDELYGDYWRFTPLGLKWLFEQNGMKLVWLAGNDNPWYPIYLLAVASRRPGAWTGRFGERDSSQRLGMTTYIYEGCIR